MSRLLAATLLVLSTASMLHSDTLADLEQVRGLLKQAEAAEREDRSEDLFNFADQIILALEGDLNHPYPVPEVLNLAARAFLLQGRNDEAYHALRECFARDAHHAECLGTRVLLHFRESDVAGACEAVELAMAAGDRTATTRFFKGLCHDAKGEVEEAFAAMKRAVELDPADVHPLLQQGLWLVRDGRREEAEVFYREAVKAAPSMARAHAALAFFLTEGGEIEQAAEHWRMARELNPANIQWWGHLIASLDLLGQDEERAKLRAEINEARLKYEWKEDKFILGEIEIGPWLVTCSEVFEEELEEMPRYRFDMVRRETGQNEGRFLLTRSTIREQGGEKPWTLDHSADSGLHVVLQEWEAEPTYQEVQSLVRKEVQKLLDAPATKGS